MGIPKTAKELEAQRKWRARNKERISAYNKEYAKANPDKVREKNLRHKARHREQLAEKQRAYMASFTAEERRQAKRAEFLRNRDTYRENAKRYYAENAEDQKRKARAWTAANPERRAAYLMRYRTRKRELYWANHAENVAKQARRRGVRAAGEHYKILLDDPCAYCYDPADTVDHIHPVSKGGGGEWENLAAACRSCNSAKRDRLLLRYLLDESEPRTEKDSPDVLERRD